MAQGAKVSDAVKQIDVTEQTFYRWKKLYGSMAKTQLRELKELKKENAQLKKLVGDLSLDKAILKEVLEGKY